MRASKNFAGSPARRTLATILIVSCAALAIVVSAQQRAPLTLVSTVWPPFTNQQGQARFALDLVEAALGRIGVSSKTSIVPAPQFTSSLLGGQFDGSGAAWKDAEREQSLIFSKPYLENRLVLVGRRGGDVSAKSLAELKGKRVAIVEGYSYGDTLELGGPIFVRSSSEEDSLARLLRSAVDYTLMDELVVNYLVKNYPKESASRLQIGSAVLLTRDLYLAIRRNRPDAESIISGFNAQLPGMIADRTYHRLLHVDWIRADVSGNGVPVYVPANDRPAPFDPQSVYNLFSAAEPAEQTSTPQKTGFYVGGNIYSDWASVPDAYKEGNNKPPDPRRATASLFTFKW
jgi:polar amino acid transport system substrate-binding protein